MDIKGAGVIAGVGNGNPQSIDPFQANQVKLFYGKAMVIVRSVMESGKVELKASAKGLSDAQATIQVE